MDDYILELIGQWLTDTIDAVADVTARRSKRVHWSDEVTLDQTVLVRQSASRSLHQDDRDLVMEQDYEIVVSVIDSDDATTAIDTRINRVSATILEALLADRTAGDYAQHEGLRYNGSRRIDDAEARVSGEVLMITVTYTVQMSDFKVRGLR